MTQLPPFPGDPDSAATAINDKGQVVGISGLCSNAVGGASAVHALLWENGKPIDLGNLGAEVWNTPVAINNHGVVVGFAYTTAGVAAAFVWTKAKGKMEEVYPFGTDTTDVLYDVNEKNQAVGVSANPSAGTARAILWQNNAVNDLNALVIQPTSLYLTLAQGINDAGEITGTATDTSTGETVGFLAIPVFDGSENPDLAAEAKVNANPHEVILTGQNRRQLPFLTRMILGAGTR